MISKTLGQSQRFGRLTEYTCGGDYFPHALYPLLVASADDFGRLEGDVYTLRYRVWTTSLASEARFDAALEALAAVGLIQRYIVDGRFYLQIINFERHQGGLQKRTHSQFPDPTEFQETPEFRGSARNSGNSGNSLLTKPNLTKPKRTGTVTS